MSEPRYLRSTALCEALGLSRGAIARLLDAHPGLGISTGTRRLIPREHFDRLLNGEPPDQIALEARVRWKSSV